MTRLSKPILPGATVGVLGSGQLGRMFAIAARRMGYRVHTFSPDNDTPTGQVADLEVVGAYDDLDAVRSFAKKVSVVTFEFENVPAATAAAAEQFAPVRPDGNVLHITQHRLREKTFLSQNGFPVTPFRTVKTVEDLREAVSLLGLPSILKIGGTPTLRCRSDARFSKVTLSKSFRFIYASAFLSGLALEALAAFSGCCAGSFSFAGTGASGEIRSTSPNQ